MGEKDQNRPIEVGGGLAIFVISYNKSINFLQKAVREKLLFGGDMEGEPAEAPENDPAQLEYQFNLINTAIENLPAQKKLAFTLCRLEGAKTL